MQRPILAFVAIVLFSLPAPITSAQLPEFPFVFAEGQAKTELPPDIANVSYQVLAYDGDPSVALSIVHKRSGELIALFKESGIAVADIVSFEIDKSVRRRGSDHGDDLEISGYELSRRFDVTIRDLGKYTSFMTALFVMENIDNVLADFGRTDRERVETELIAKATSDARRRARTMATGAGAELGPVFALSQTDFAYTLGKFGLEASNWHTYSVAASGTLIEEEQFFVPATVTFRSTVHVIYELKRP